METIRKLNINKQLLISKKDKPSTKNNGEAKKEAAPCLCSAHHTNKKSRQGSSRSIRLRLESIRLAAGKRWKSSAHASQLKRRSSPNLATARQRPSVHAARSVQ